MYRSDEDALPDDAFVAGDLRYLVVGNRGRLLDPRRTPVHVTGVLTRPGFFEITIDDFEDAGARWLVPLEEVNHYQFATQSQVAGPSAVSEMRAALARFDITIVISAGAARCALTHREMAAVRSAADRWLTGHGAPEHFDPRPFIDAGSGWDRAFDWLHGYLTERGVAGMERRFAGTYVSNPGSGETVKGHLMVMAELGLCSYTGSPARDPATFLGDQDRAARTAHIIARTGFVRALWERAEPSRQMLYRGLAVQDRLGRRPASLVSATFSRAVAEEHFSSARTPGGMLARQELPIDRLFMTFLETPEMNNRYHEVEAVLFADAEQVI